jgi:glycosyltransferase involved in cell wall biosynthesis
LLSIIIPTFNSAETVLESYQSALDTGIKDQEIIFVDDGSTDETCRIIGDIQTNAPQITFLRNPRNLGGGATRNRGVYQAKNPLIFILDSDDVLLPGSLVNAVDELNLLSADGVASAQSIFFSTNILNPIKIIKYEPGYSTFINLVSHIPNPIIGNLLFKKQAFLDVGGYPTHHSFDTQGFGFRLLQNNKKIIVGNEVIYYQRLPLNPSYYVREARAGNINRNWFYIFFECLYKFSPRIRKLILEFPFANPYELAKGRNLFNVLADQSASPDFYCPDSIDLDEHVAYRTYSDSNDLTLNAWCFQYELKFSYYEAAFARYNEMNLPSNQIRLMFPLIAKIIGNKLTTNEIKDLSYFFSQEKSPTWKISFTMQKIFNRLKIGKYL